MPRILRRNIIFSGGVYHVYARGNNHMQLFRDHADYQFYLSTIAELKVPSGVLLHHYSLMPNHLHFLLRVAGIEEFSKFMRVLQIRFAKHFARKYEFVGHVWEGRFKSRVIESDGDLFACGNYSEMNPVRAGLVGDPGNWPYSSYRFYAYGEPNALVDVDPLYNGLGKTAAARQVAYRNLISRTRMNSRSAVPGTTATDIVVPGTKG